MSSTIDLRSDTVTLPPPEMRQAIARGPLGDDVYGEDPTANALEALVADIVRRGDATLTPSRTMANVIALIAHCSFEEGFCWATCLTSAMRNLPKPIWCSGA